MDAVLPVEVVYALREGCRRWRIGLPAGGRVGDALDGLAAELAAAGVVVDPARLAIFGRPATRATALHAGDRIEILRPLLADPKQARRQRAARSGA